jgi:RNA 2',3'-cyclic 3'-phosphodiesterase
MGGGKVADAIRAFVALDLDAKSVRRVVRLADRLRMASGAPSATWTPQGDVHLTLKFMPALPSAAVVPLGKALEALARAGSPPQPGTCRLQAFPSVERASVIVIELADPLGEVSKLAAMIEKLSGRRGVARDSRAFVPHVTLARLKRPYDARRWLRPELADAAGEFTVSHLTLYRSDLGAGKQGGSLYVPLARFDYGPA